MALIGLAGVTVVAILARLLADGAKAKFTVRAWAVYVIVSSGLPAGSVVGDTIASVGGLL
ncbi:hypothetical protein [Halomarina oriensis]|uniref:Uncharacterized protein n=1 Tax=Halomarina oriensis TaxID=671145 RepID=A0A6B0GJX1_9EURY|nr:hypothetical protein [Halomarina oriensis]MWG34161.1 hypothetical protein [Halomarina oriensis]